MTEEGFGSGYEVLEHTADVGLRIWAPTLEGVFSAACEGMVEILGAEGAAPPAGEPRSVDVHAEAAEVEGLLVDWLSEVLYHLDESEACLAGVRGLEVDETSLRATLDLSPCEQGWSGTELKAATYHQLSLARDDAGWRGTVFFDV